MQKGKYERLRAAAAGILASMGSTLKILQVSPEIKMRKENAAWNAQIEAKKAAKRARKGKLA